jgi:sensor histidine kinase YesM
MLDHLIAYLRATLGASRATLHPLADEFDRLRDYLELMAVRMGPRLRYTLDLPERPAPGARAAAAAAAAGGKRHPPWAGAPGGRRHITVRAACSTRHPAHRAPAQYLVLEVHDTGVGLAPGASRNGPSIHTGFGLAQVRERLATCTARRPLLN